MTIAVILFPGTNCEEETARACKSVGLNAEIVRWNSANIESYDGYILPGGFSYEDRVRAGVISAKDPILKIIKKEAKKGKPVLGICNGCQILIESGLIPGLKDKVEMALAPNINNDFKGYLCQWVYIKNSSSAKNAFNLYMENNEIMPIPIAHAEGRFTTREKGLIDTLIKNNQILFQYCDKNGQIVEEANPNGSINNVAGICNKEGNVMAMMPHPERCSWKRQLPDSIMSEMQGISEHAQMSKKQSFFDHTQKSMIFDESLIFDMSEIANAHTQGVLTQSKQAISEHAQEHAPHFSAAVLDMSEEQGPGSKIFLSMKKYIEGM